MTVLDLIKFNKIEISSNPLCYFFYFGDDCTNYLYIDYLIFIIRLNGKIICRGFSKDLK